jgi:3'(2'), 5'-bisphosphate nucleotidase
MIQLESHYLKALETSVIASDEIMRIYQTSFQKTYKSDGSPVTEADTVSSEIITGNLARFGVPIICEEDPKISYNERKKWDDVWIVDPLDGTKEFIRRNGEFAVNIALVRNGNPVFGIIASPVKRQILFGGKEYGTFITDFENLENQNNWKMLGPSETNNPIVLASSRTPYKGKEIELIDTILQQREIDYVKKGSSLKFFDLAEGKADVYPRFAPTMEWDIAAGQAILEPLGGVVLNAETGNPLTYNKESLLNPYFIAKTKGFINLFG